MADVGELGIYSETPALDQWQKRLSALLVILFGNNRAMILWDLCFILLATWTVSHAARLHSTSSLFRGVIFVLLLIVTVAWGRLLAVRFLPLITAMEFGGPIYGALGGSPRRLYFLCIRCANAIQFNFAPDDLETVRTFGRIDTDITEWQLKTAYRRLLESRNSDKLQQFDQNWNRVWQDEILSMKIRIGPNKFITCREAFSEDNAGLRIEPLKLTAVGIIVAVIMKMIQVVVIVMLAAYLDGRIHMLTVVQTGLCLSLVMCLIVFNYHSHQNSEIPLLGSIVGELPEDIENRLRPLVGKVVRPNKVTVNKRYLTMVQNYFAELLANATLVNTALLLVLVLLTLGITRILQPAVFHAVVPWYKSFSIGLICIPVFLFVSYHAIFFALRNLKLFFAPVIIGLLTALLPYLFTYLAGGRVSLDQIHNSYLAVFTGLAGGLTASITARVKKNLEADGDNEEKSPKAAPVAE